MSIGKGEIGLTEVRAVGIALALEVFGTYMNCKSQMTYEVIVMVYLIPAEKFRSEKDESLVVGS